MTKLKFLKEMHTVTKISEDSETAFYIYFLIYNKTKNKQPPNSKLLALNFSFYLFTPTIDKEPFYDFLSCRVHLRQILSFSLSSQQIT